MHSPVKQVRSSTGIGVSICSNRFSLIGNSHLREGIGHYLRPSIPQELGPLTKGPLSFMLVILEEAHERREGGGAHSTLNPPQIIPSEIEPSSSLPLSKHAPLNTARL